jgi:methylmalonyl-CoA mutase N-terminal domain/subunit
MVEALTEQFIEKTWAEVQVLSKLTEKEAIERTKEKIQQSQSLQLEAFKSGSQTYIGMNAFMNADSSKAKNWTALPSYWGMNYMNFEIQG